MHVIEMVSEALDGGRLGGRIIWREKWSVGLLDSKKKRRMAY